MKREDAQNEDVTHTVFGSEPPWTCDSGDNKEQVHQFMLAGHL
eukprot:COSAG02_NODE_1989_length_10174_cov_12.502134_12_plen_43_part_00